MRSEEVMSKSNIDKLHSRICKIMIQIRKSTPRTAVDSNVAKGSDLWNGRSHGKEVKRLVIYLRSRGCAWVVGKKMNGKTHFKPGCFDCEHSISGTTFGDYIKPKSFVNQFTNELKKYDKDRIPILCIYNEGNFFNEAELPEESRIDILKAVNKCTYVETLIVESLPRFLTPTKLAQTRDVLGDKNVEIGIGLESSDEVIRKLCINKPDSLQEFTKAIEIIKPYFKVLAYVLVKPSFLSEREAVIDGVNTIKYAFSQGVDVVSIEPVNISDHNLSGYLNRLGLYRPVWLWSIVEMLRKTHALGHIRVGGYQFEPKYRWHSYNCPKCTKPVLNLMNQFNATGKLHDILNAKCKCLELWSTEMNQNHLPLLDRIVNEIEQLEFFLNNSS